MIKDMINTAKIVNEQKKLNDSINDSKLTINRVSGQGTQTDISIHTLNIPGQQIPYNTMVALFSGSDICRKIVSKLPTEAFKQGIDIEMQNKELASELVMQLDDMAAVLAFQKAAIYARNFGGSLIIMGIDDGRDPNEPVNFDKIKRIYSMDVVDRRWCFPIEFDQDPYSPFYGEPLTYQVQPYSGFTVKPQIIHRDRLIRFDGFLTTDDEKAKRNWWDLCIYDFILPIINDFDSVYNLSVNQMNKSTQGVFKVKNLTEALSGLTASLAQSRFDIVDAFRSVYRSIVIDADNEEFTYEESSLANWDKMIESFIIRLASAADMPVIVLTGNSLSGGLSSSSEADLRLWYSSVKAYQRQYLKPRFEYLIKLIMASKKIEEPGKWSVVFPDLYEPTPSELTAKRKATAEIDNICINAGVFSAEEVALFRSQPGGYDKDMTLTDLGKVEREAKVLAKSGQILAEPATAQIKDPEITEKEEVKTEDLNKANVNE